METVNVPSHSYFQLAVLIIGQAPRYINSTTTERSIFMGLFGDLFDFDGDGTTDAFETALGLSIVFSIGEDEKQNTCKRSGKVLNHKKYNKSKTSSVPKGTVFSCDDGCSNA